MRALARCVLVGSLAFVAPPQEPEPSIADELEALIAKTNALHSFHLVLRGDESSLELAYQEPWSARMTLTTPDDVLDWRVDGQRIYFLGEDWRACDLPRSKAQTTLDELFPMGCALGPGAVFELHSTMDSWCIPLFDVSGRDALFRWLREMQSDLEHVTRSDEALVWSTGNLELHLSRTTGLPERILVRKDDQELELVLQESSTDSEVAEFVAPPEDWEPAGDDNGLARAFAQLSDARFVRQRGFERVEAQLTAKKRTWDARTRADWESFAETLHEDRIASRWQAWIEPLRAGIDEHVEWVRKELAQEDSPARRAFMVQYFAEIEAQLQKDLPGPQEMYLAELPKPAKEAPREELFAAERAVIERLHEKLVVGPSLAYFHQQVEAVLGK